MGKTMLVYGAAAAALVLGCAAQVHAQGAGSAGAQILQMDAGSRAPALSGAYVASSHDSDVIFYNPAGVAALDGAAALSLQRLVESVTFGSVSGLTRLGPVWLAAGLAYLDAGEIDVIEPDPAFGGQRGIATGERVGARETAARIAAALPLAGGRLRVGVGAGYVSSDMAGASRGAPVFDLGGQVGLGAATLGVALRNLGPDLADGGGGLPTELRAGVAAGLPALAGLAAQASVEAVGDLEAGILGLAAGLEAGLLPAAAAGVDAVLRLGYGHHGSEGLGGFRVGIGVGVGRAAFDYTFQRLEHFGTAHRVGLRFRR